MQLSIEDRPKTLPQEEEKAHTEYIQKMILLLPVNFLHTQRKTINCCSRVCLDLLQVGLTLALSTVQTMRSSQVTLRLLVSCLVSTYGVQPCQYSQGFEMSCFCTLSSSIYPIGGVVFSPKPHPSILPDSWNFTTFIAPRNNLRKISSNPRPILPQVHPVDFRYLQASERLNRNEIRFAMCLGPWGPHHSAIPENKPSDLPIIRMPICLSVSGGFNSGDGLIRMTFPHLTGGVLTPAMSKLPGYLLI